MKYKKINLPNLIVFMMGFGLLGGCGKQDSYSQVLGHFEDYSEADLVALKGKLSVVPEYHRSSDVLLAFDIIRRFSLGPLFEAILKNEAGPNISVIVEANQQDEAKRYFSQLSQNLGADVLKKISYMTAPAATDPSTDSTILWVRDWAPWTAKYSDQQRSERRLVEFNYYERRGRGDQMPRDVSTYFKIPRVSMPVRTEGGNFMINSQGDCLVTTGMYEREERIKKYPEEAEILRRDLASEKDAQRRDMILRRLKKLEYLISVSKSYTRDEVDNLFRDYIGCRRVVALEPSPADYNQHIDLFAKFISDDIVLVHELDAKTMAIMSNQKRKDRYYRAAMNFLQRVRDHLDRVSSQLTDAGLHVVRAPLPMPYAYSEKMPIDLDGSSVDATSDNLALDTVNRPDPIIGAENGNVGELHMRSYLNSLILNGKVYVPRFKAPAPSSFDWRTGKPIYPLVLGMAQDAKRSVYPDEYLLKYYEEKVTAAYAAAGLETVFIDGDKSVYASGSIHCLSMQVGADET